MRDVKKSRIQRIWGTAQGLAVLATIAATVIALATYAETSRAAFLVRFETVTQLLGQQLRSVDKSQLLLNGKSIESPFVVLAVLTNSGTSPLREADFESAVRFEFAKARLLNGAVVRLHPTDLKATMRSEGNAAEIRPGLMNPGDQIMVELLADGEPEVPQVLGRIAGVRALSTELAFQRRAPSPAFFLRVPRWTEFLMAVVVAIWGLVIVGTVVAALRPIFAVDPKKISSAAFAVIAPQKVFQASLTRTQDADLHAVAGSVASEAELDWFDSPRPIREALAEKMPEFGDAQREEIAARVHTTLKRYTPHAILDLVRVTPRINNDPILLRQLEGAIGAESPSESALVDAYGYIQESLRRCGEGKPAPATVFATIAGCIALAAFAAPLLLLCLRAVVDVWAR